MNSLKIKFFLCILFGFLFFGDSTYAAINYNVTPLKYDIQAEPGDIITRSAQIKNNGPDTVTLTTTSSDFQANGTDGTPSFIRKSELVHPDQVLSSWISIHESSITLAPGETKGMTFDIHIPNNATPGGHYGAVLFKNPNSEASGGGIIGINVDYGVILLVNVSGDIVVDIDINDVIISSGSHGGGGGGGPSGAHTGSPDENRENTGENNNKNFEILFQLPIDNNGNTHVKPNGKITLLDENGETIQGVGKEVKTNEHGTYVGEEIVNYLPLNDEGGSILAKTKRTFETTWKGFPYKTYDTKGNPILEYWTPGEYYTNNNIKNDRFLMFWERVRERKNIKHVQAVIELSYADENGNDLQYNAADEFEIEYTEQYIGLNPYIVTPLGIFFFFGLLLWFLIAKRRKICINKKCKKRIRRTLKLCPYCTTLQKEKMNKKTKKKNKKKK